MGEGMCDIFNMMTRNGVAHQAALNVIADLYDGRHMWGFTEKDIKNMQVLLFFPPYTNCDMSLKFGLKNSVLLFFLCLQEGGEN
jgi:hypothetical protein